MAVSLVQNTFTRGELDPRLFARSDFDGYFKGAKQLRNLIVIPQGGAKRRFGTTFGFGLEDEAGDPIEDISEITGVLYDFTPTSTFLILIAPWDRTGGTTTKLWIYLDDVLKYDEEISYTIAQIPDIRFVRAQTGVVVLHPSVQPNRLGRAGADTAWDFDPIPFINYPTYDFSFFDGIDYRTGNTFKVSATTGASITLTASAASTFRADHNGGIFVGIGGIGRIINVTSGTTATMSVIEPFTEATVFYPAADCQLRGAAWDNWTGGSPVGKNRGWPSMGCFFQNRLVLANTATLPNVVWFSMSADPLNFNDEDPDATMGFALGAGTDGNDELQDVIGSKSVIGLGLSGIYSTTIFTDQPITPANASFFQQDRTGSSDIGAQLIDGQVFFVDENTEQVNSAIYDIASATLNVTNASILSPQVIKEVVSTATFRPLNDHGSFYLASNSDGTLAVFQSLLAENVRAWTLSDTRGSFGKLIASRGSCYCINRRQISTGSTAEGTIQNAYTANEDFEAFVDVSASLASGASDVTLFASEDDYLLLGQEIAFSYMDVDLATPSSDDLDLTFEYLDRDGNWNLFTVTDDTSGFQGSSFISWSLSDTPDWFPVNIEDKLGITLPPDTVSPVIEKFWMRIRRTEATVTTPPIENTILINVADRAYIESITFDEYVDSGITANSDSNGLITGLTHLIGQQVYAIANDIPEGPYFVNSSGQITIRATDVDDVVIGINYIPVLEPMPLVSESQAGINMYEPKHLKSIYIDYFESLGITLNGEEIPTLKIGELVLDQMPQPVTDVFHTFPMRGWNPRGTNIISQELPLPMTIIGIGYKLEI